MEGKNFFCKFPKPFMMTKCLINVLLFAVDALSVSKNISVLIDGKVTGLIDLDSIESSKAV